MMTLTFFTLLILWCLWQEARIQLLVRAVCKLRTEND